MRLDRSNETGYAALHVHCAAAEELARPDFAREWRQAPCGFRPRGHHIGVACKHQMRAFRSQPRIEVLDIWCARFAEDRALDGKSERLKHRLQGGECAALIGRNRRAANEVAQDLCGS